MKPKTKLIKWNIMMLKLIIKKNEQSGEGSSAIKHKADLKKVERKLQTYLESNPKHA